MILLKNPICRVEFLQDTYTRAGPLYSFKWWGKFREGLSLLGTKFWNYVRTVKIVTYHAMIYSLGREYPSQYGGSFRHRSLCREISRQKTDIRPQSTLAVPGRSWFTSAWPEKYTKAAHQRSRHDSLIKRRRLLIYGLGLFFFFFRNFIMAILNDPTWSITNGRD